MKRGIIVLLAAALLIIGCGGTSTTTLAPTTTVAVVTTTTAAPTTTAALITTTTENPIHPVTSRIADPVTTSTANPVTTTAPVWTEVTSLRGSANKRGELFFYNGLRARLTYKVTGESPMVLIYLVEAGKSLEKDGGFPEVTVTQAGADSTMLAKDAGSYYLDVSSANCQWTVTIEERQ